MWRRINAHWSAVRILGCDVVVHLKEIAVALFDRGASKPLDCVCEIEIHPPPTRPYPTPLIAYFFRRARGDVARREISKARIFPLEVVIALVLRDFLRRALVPFLFRHPDAAVIAQRFRHQRQFRLIFARLRNACRVNLRVTRIRKVRTATMRTPYCCAIRRFCVRRQIEDICVAAGAEDHSVAGVGFNRSTHKVACDDSLGLPVNDYEIEHFVAWKHLHAAECDLPFERLECAEEKLLARLPAGVESARDLYSAE